MTCERCNLAADYGRMRYHCMDEGCTCHHHPIEGEPRLKGIARRVCYVCGQTVAVTKEGYMRVHRHLGKACDGGGR